MGFMKPIGTALLAVVVILVANCKHTSEPLEAGPTHPAGILSESLASPGRPHGVAIAPNGHFCISQIDGNAVSCGELTLATIQFDVANVPVGQSPAHVALNSTGTEVFTADQGSRTASFVDIVAGRSIATVPLNDDGFNVLAHPSAQRLYVTTASGQLHVVDTDSHTNLARINVGAAANGLALDVNANRLYVSSRDASTVTAIDLQTNQVSRAYAVGLEPQRIALSHDGKTLYIATEGAGLEYLNLATGTRTAVDGVSAGAVGLALSPDNQQIYITNPPLGIVQVVDVATHEVMQTINGLGRPRNVAFGLQGAAALVTNELGNVYVVR